MEDLCLLPPSATRSASGPASLRDPCWNRVQPFEVALQVVAVGVFRDGECKKDPGLENAAELLSQVGHFHGVANRLFPIVEFLVARSKPIDLGLLGEESAARAGCPSCSANRASRSSSVRSPGSTAGTRSVPGVRRRHHPDWRQAKLQPIDLGRSRFGGRQVGQGLSHDVDAVGRDAPVNRACQTGTSSGL